MTTPRADEKAHIIILMVMDKVDRDGYLDEYDRIELVEKIAKALTEYGDLRAKEAVEFNDGLVKTIQDVDRQVVQRLLEEARNSALEEAAKEIEKKDNRSFGTADGVQEIYAKVVRALKSGEAKRV